MSIFAKRLDIGGSGARVAIKDTIDIAGYPTIAGSRALAGAPPAPRNAEIVDRIFSAGCRIVGKTNLHELAFGVTGINDWAGTSPNPRFPDLVPGGSSSGSAAAVAAGEADFAIGTDTGGSIRIPAACCGVYGFKPSFGRVSRLGVAPARSTLDCVGPFAASMAWLIRGMEVIDPSFKAETGTKATLGIVTVDARDDIRLAVADAVEASGLPWRPAKLAGLQSAFQAGLALINAETSAAFGHLVATGLVGEDVAMRLRAAAETTDDDIDAANLVRTEFQHEVDGALERCDVLVLPTMAGLPPSLLEARANRAAISMTTLVRPFNLSGHPALTLPITIPGRGLAGLQLVGRRGADGLVCGLAEQISAALERRAAT